MDGNQTILEPPEPGSAGAQATSGRAAERKAMNFTFDKSYWSAGPRDEPQYCSQQTLYDDLGKELLDHGFAGFNACIVACECIQCSLRWLNAELWIRWTDRCVLKGPARRVGRLIQCGVPGSGKSYSMMGCTCHSPISRILPSPTIELNRRSRQGYHPAHLF